MRIGNIFATIFLSGLAAGCANLTHYKSGIDLTNNGYSIDAKQRFIMSLPDRRNSKHRVVCAEPSPDALSAVAANFGAGASIVGQGSGQAAGALAESAGSIGLRTATVTLLRDAFYRVCEGYMNNATDRFGYALMMTAIDDTVLNVMAIEALTGAVKADSLALSGKAKSPTLNLTVTESSDTSVNISQEESTSGDTSTASSATGETSSSNQQDRESSEEVSATQSLEGAEVSSTAKTEKADAKAPVDVEAVTHAVLEIVKNDRGNSYGNLVAACAFALGAEGGGSRFGTTLTDDFRQICNKLVTDAGNLSVSLARGQQVIATTQARTAETQARTENLKARADLAKALTAAKKAGVTINP